jgi:hypothetical protein
MKSRKSLGWRAALATAAAIAAVVVAPLTGVQAAHAQEPYPPVPPEIGLSATTVSPGDRLRFRAGGFQPSQEVTAVLLSRVIELGVFRANQNGVVTGAVTIPRRVEPGWHTFQLRAEDPDRTLSADLFVLPCDRDRDRRCGRNRDNDERPEQRDRNENEPRETNRDTSALGAGGAAAMVAVGGGALLGARRLKKR